MGDFFKALFSLKALQIGWAVFWRSFLVILVNLIIVGILGWLLQSIANVYNVIAGIYIIIVEFLALGWAVMRIKDKL